MDASRFQRAAGYVLLGAGLLALAYSIWLGGILLTIQIGAGLVATDSGIGLFVLVYAALPVAVACLSLSHLIARRPWRPGGVALTAFAFLLAMVQLLWLVDLAPRTSGELVPFAIATTLVVVGVGFATLGTRTRLVSASRPGATGR